MNQPITVVELPATSCFLGAECTWIGPGHAMAFAQEHIASSEHDGWRDSVVDTVSPGGWICLTALDDDSQTLAWNHCDVLSALSPGDPVTLNVAHHVLAAGDNRFNVLVT